MTLVYIAIGVGLLALGIAVARVRAALRRPGKHIDKTVTDPVLLDGWDPPSK